MEFLRKILQSRISEATGATVRFGSFSFSPFSGAVSLDDVLIAASPEAEPFIAIRHIDAKLVIARALNREIVIKSLAIEGPRILLHRAADGSTNLPHKPAAPSPGPASAAPSTSTPWALEAQRVLVVDGSIELIDERLGAYHLMAELLSASVEMPAADRLEFVVTVQSLSRRDQPVELGAVRGHGTLRGIDWEAIANAALELTIEAPPRITLTATARTLRGPLSVQLQAEGDLAQAVRLLPSTMPLPLKLSGNAALKASFEIGPLESS